MKIKIDGGKLFVDGVEANVKRDDNLVSGTVDNKPLLISAGAVYMNGSCVGEIPYENFKAWRETL